MTRSPGTARRHGVAAAVAAATLAGTAATALTAPPALATGGAAQDDAPAGAVTWSLVPADASGPDGRRSIDVTLDPGEATTEHVALTNDSDVAVTFDLDAADGYLTPNGTYDLRAPEVEPVDGGAWIDLDDAVDVGPGDTVVVPFTVSVPADATPGDHPAGVAASVATGDGVVTVRHRVGVRLDVHVPGTVSADVDVTDVSARFAAPWNPFRPGTVEVSATLADRGNVSVAVAGSATVDGPWGLGPERSGASARTVDLIPGGAARTHLEVDRVWPLGRVTATLVVTPTALDESVDVAAESRTVAVTTWALPWPQVLLVLLAAAAVLGVRALVAARRERLAAMLRAAHAQGAAEERSRDT